MEDKKQELSFEAAISDLDGLVRRLESGELSLSESLDAYADAVKLSRACAEMLENAEQRIRILQAGESGEIAERPFTAEDGR